MRLKSKSRDMSKYKYSIFKTHFIQTMLYKEWHRKKNHSPGLYPSGLKKF